MKFLFNLLLITTLSSTIQAREIIVISYENEASQTLSFMKNYFDNNPDIKKFITYKKSLAPCKQKYKDVILHLCIDKSDESHVIESDKEVLKKTMANFVLE